MSCTGKTGISNLVRTLQSEGESHNIKLHFIDVAETKRPGSEVAAHPAVRARIGTGTIDFRTHAESVAN